MCGDQRTIYDNRLPALFRTTDDPAPTSVRGLARLFHGWTDVVRSRTALRLLSRRVPRAVPCLSPRASAGVLCDRPDRSSRATEEEPCPRADRGAAPAQLLRL